METYSLQTRRYCVSESTLLYIARGAAFLSALVGFAAILSHVWNGAASLPLVPLGFTLAGISTLLTTDRRAAAAGWIRPAAAVCVLGILAVSGLALAEAFVPAPPVMERGAGRLGAVPESSLLPAGGVSLALIGVALLLLTRGKATAAAHGMALAASFFGAMAFASHLLEAPWETGRAASPVAYMLAALVGVGVMGILPHRGLSAMLTQQRPYTAVMTRLLPLLLCIPFLVAVVSKGIQVFVLAELRPGAEAGAGALLLVLGAGAIIAAPAILAVAFFYRRDNDLLRASEARYRHLFDSNPQPIWIYDTESLAILDANRAAFERYGYAREEFLTLTLRDVCHEDDLPALLDKLSTASEDQELTGFRHRKRDGGVIEVESVPHSILVDGRPARLVINNDVTEKNRVEAQLLRTQRMESIGTLAGGIAHDLNNVLAPVLMGVELLKERVTDASSLGLLDMMAASARRGAGIVRQVLTFARGADGEKGSIAPRHLIGGIEKMLRETFPKSIAITTDVPKDLWTIVGDPTQLDQVLLNLCVNARDAMPHGGTLHISAENTILDEHYTHLNREAAAGPHIVIQVADTGCGIPAHIREKIFEPFFTTKSVGKGTGLGLSTVRSIAKSHNGFTTVTSEVDRGSQFRVYLPARETAETREAGLKHGRLPTGRGELVLVVDDEAAVRDITRLTLESYNYRVLTASDGAEALACYARRAEEIKVVLLDMMMPVMDGAATSRVLQSINPAIRIIAVTGLLDEGKHAALTDRSSSVRAILSKPYTAERLLTALHEVIGVAVGAAAGR